MRCDVNGFVSSFNLLGIRSWATLSGDDRSPRSRVGHGRLIFAFAAPPVTSVNLLQLGLIAFNKFKRCICGTNSLRVSLTLNVEAANLIFRIRFVRHGDDISDGLSVCLLFLACQSSQH